MIETNVTEYEEEEANTVAKETAILQFHEKIYCLINLTFSWWLLKKLRLVTSETRLWMFSNEILVWEKFLVFKSEKWLSNHLPLMGWAKEWSEFQGLADGEYNERNSYLSSSFVFYLSKTWNKSNIVSKCHQKLRISTQQQTNNEKIIFVFVMSNGLLLHTQLHPLLDNFFMKWIQSPHPTFGMFWKAKNKILPYHWPIKNFHIHSSARMTC